MEYSGSSADSGTWAGCSPDVLAIHAEASAIASPKKRFLASIRNFASYDWIGIALFAKRRKRHARSPVRSFTTMPKSTLLNASEQATARCDVSLPSIATVSGVSEASCEDPRQWSHPSGQRRGASFV